MAVQVEDTVDGSDQDMIDVKVWRGGDQGSYQVFAVPRRANQTVLDVVTWILCPTALPAGSVSAGPAP